MLSCQKTFVVPVTSHLFLLSLHKFRTMISKAKLKYIHSLERKKNRKEEGVFVAEGPKVVGDLLEVMPAKMVVATSDWWNRQSFRLKDAETIEVTDEELRKVSFLQHPQEVLAVFPQREVSASFDVNQCAIALDDVQDPGNLGTIIRIADWFGIEKIFCSENTADVYNPKVIQATMGSISRVDVVYADLLELIDSLPMGYPVYGTFLDGESIYSKPLTTNGLIVMGNEGNGISPQVAERVNRRLLIPNFPEGRVTADSLNVAIATAITCAEFRRQMIMNDSHSMI